MNKKIAGSLKKCLVVVIALVFSLLLACNAKQSLTEKVMKLETSEYDLSYFKIDYNEYLAQADGITDDAYLNSTSDQAIFGDPKKIYTKKDLNGMPRDEWNKLRSKFLNLIKSLGLDDPMVTVQFSDPYSSEEGNQKYIFTSELKEIKNKPFTKTNKRYTLKLIKGNWLVTGVEFDHFTYGSDRTKEEIKTKVAEMKYQEYEGHPVKYNKGTLILRGVATD